MGISEETESKDWKMIDGQYRYYAFISYKREDEEWAKWLQHKLEHYKLPSNLNGRTDLPKEIRPVFKDTSELTPGNLPEQISQALEQSKFLIVICSPRSAQSEWVNKEIETFKSLGKTGNIIPLVIAGRPFSSNSVEECFPKAILSLPSEQEILGANINEMGRDAAAVKIVARMFDIRFDELWQRHEREKRRRKNIVVASVIAFILFLIGISFWMYKQKNETMTANWKMMENQARMIAEKSRTEVSKGNAYDAILALLETIPQDDERPSVIETEQALRFAYSSLLSHRWNYRLLGSNFNKVYFSDDEKLIICLSFGPEQDVVEVYDAKSLQLVSQIISPDREMWDFPACIFPSYDSKMICVSSGKNGVLCYDIFTGKLLGKKTWTKDMLEHCMAYNWECCNIDTYDYYWEHEIARIIGMPERVTIHAHSTKWHLILYEVENEKQGDGVDYVLYDYVTHQEIRRFDNHGHLYNWDDGNELTRASFSSEAKYLAMAFKDGTGKIVNLSDLSEKKFNCGNVDCCHYSNWLLFGRNNDLLHSSMFEETIKRYNGQSLELIDSLNSNDNTFNDYVGVDMSSDGSMCIVQDYASHYIFYYTKGEKRDSIYVSMESFGDYMNVSDTLISGRYKIGFTENGVEFRDLKNEVKGWSLNDPKINYGLYGFIHHDKYLLLSKEGFRGSFEGIDIVDMLTGTLMDQVDHVFLDSLTGHVILNKMRIGPNDDIYEEYEEFVPFEELVSSCKKITEGMKLSDAARNKFFLN